MDIHSVSKRFSISPPRPFLPSFFFTSSMLFELSLKRDIRLYPALSTDVRKWKNGCTWIFIQFETFSLSPSSYPFLSSIFFPDPEISPTLNVHTCIEMGLSDESNLYVHLSGGKYWKLLTRKDRSIVVSISFSMFILMKLEFHDTTPECRKSN